METDEFKKGIEKLITMAEKLPTVFFCAEKLFFKCHRKFIAKKLTERGFRVIDIIDERKEIQIK